MGSVNMVLTITRRRYDQISFAPTPTLFGDTA
jgi:hypothetical protein